jgi:hypothetical protein
MTEKHDETTLHAITPYFLDMHDNRVAKERCTSLSNSTTNGGHGGRGGTTMHLKRWALSIFCTRNHFGRWPHHNSQCFFYCEVLNLTFRRDLVHPSSHTSKATIMEYFTINPQVQVLTSSKYLYWSFLKLKSTFFASCSISLVTLFQFQRLQFLCYHK